MNISGRHLQRWSERTLQPPLYEPFFSPQNTPFPSEIIIPPMQSLLSDHPLSLTQMKNFQMVIRGRFREEITA
jgi:hypothetical protein